MLDITPKGFHGLHDYFNEVGKELFDAEWTGMELAARQLKSPEGIEAANKSARETYERRQEPARVDSGAHFDGGAAAIIPLKGPKLQDSTGAEYQAERAARIRRDKTKHEMISRFYDGEREASVKAPDGRIYDIEKHQWQSAGFRWQLLKGTCESGKGWELSGQILVRDKGSKTPLNSLASAERKCEEWIKGLDAKTDRPKNRDELEKTARNKFPGLSKKAFLRAWGSYAPDEWSHPGPKKKSTP